MTLHDQLPAFLPHLVPHQLPKLPPLCLVFARLLTTPTLQILRRSPVAACLPVRAGAMLALPPSKIVPLLVRGAAARIRVVLRAC